MFTFSFNLSFYEIPKWKNLDADYFPLAKFSPKLKHDTTVFAFYLVFFCVQNVYSFLAHFWIQTTSDPSTVIVQIISPEADTSRTYWWTEFVSFLQSTFVKQMFLTLVLFWPAFLAFWLITSLPSCKEMVKMVALVKSQNIVISRPQW